MLKELKFVQGAVAKKDLLPAITHFRIEGGNVRAYNGTLALSSPIALDVDCVPRAADLVKVISNCSETISLSLTKAGRLRVQSGNYVSYVECIEGSTPHVEPEGEELEVNGEALLEAIKALYPFVGDDASRPWTNGILLKGCSAYSTNNVIVAEYWIGTPFPIAVNIPKSALKEMLRVDEPPIRLQMTQNSLTFHYEDKRWIRTQLLSTEWPDLSRILDVPSNPKPIPEGLFDAIDTLKPVADKLGRLYLQGDLIRTHLEEQTGGSYIVEGMDINGIYQVQILSLLRNNIDAADFSLYPNPCMFFGPVLRGALVGLRN